MTRIIAGSARGRRLSVPASGTRPTADRVREALFSTLQSMLDARGVAWSSLTVLDGYAGSGALGLEALSRGAASVTFVEKRAPAAAIIRRNIGLVGLPGSTVVTSSMGTFTARNGEATPFGLVLLDPPYDVSSQTIAGELRALGDRGVLEPDAIIVVERARADDRSPLPWDVDQRREYGDTALWYGRYDAEGSEAGDA